MSSHIISSYNLPSDAFKKMRSLKENQSLCDVNIKINDTSLAAHKVVLASVSPYFEFMFTGKVSENGKAEIELKDLCPEAVSALIEYIYSGVLVVTDETIIKILKTADFLQITRAKEECLKFLQKNINALNCVTIKNLAKKHFFTELENKANNFIRWNFLEVIQADVFLKFTLDEVKDFLSDSSFRLAISSSLEAISTWIQYDKSTREGLKDELSLTVIGAPETLYQGELDLYDAHRQKRIYVFDEASSCTNGFFCDLNNFTLHSVPSRPQLNKFSCVAVKNSIFLLDTFTRKCCKYDTENGNWTTIEIASIENFHSRGCNIHDRIFLVAEGASKKAYNFDFEKNVLYEKPSLLFERIHPGIALKGDCIYVCGGNCGSAERLDIRTKTWRSLAQIPSHDIGRCTAVSLGDSIYCANIEDNAFYEYDTRNGKWNTNSDLPCPDSEANTTINSTEGILYAVNESGIFQYIQSDDSWPIVLDLSEGHTIQQPTCVCFVPE